MGENSRPWAQAGRRGGINKGYVTVCGAGRRGGSVIYSICKKKLTF